MTTDHVLPRPRVVGQDEQLLAAARLVDELDRRVVEVHVGRRQESLVEEVAFVPPPRVVPREEARFEVGPEVEKRPLPTRARTKIGSPNRQAPTSGGLRERSPSTSTPSPTVTLRTRREGRVRKRWAETRSEPCSSHTLGSGSASGAPRRTAGAQSFSNDW